MTKDMTKARTGKKINFNLIKNIWRFSIPDMAENC